MTTINDLITLSVDKTPNVVLQTTNDGTSHTTCFNDVLIALIICLTIIIGIVCVAICIGYCVKQSSNARLKELQETNQFELDKLDREKTAKQNEQDSDQKKRESERQKKLAAETNKTGPTK